MARRDKDREKQVKYFREEFWPQLEEATNNSEEHFDTKIFAVSSGAFAIELAILQFIKKPADCFAKWAAALLIVTLLLNISVHLIGQSFQHSQSKAVEEFINGEESSDDKIYRKIKKQDRTIHVINIISLLTLVVGISFLAAFTLTNI